ncbi:MAG: hypothetical protein RL023_817 [Candidatus Parcubacteria bacterium]|jgi:predicted small integral membrane protein
MKQTLLSFFMLCCLFVTNTFSLKVRIPSENERDIVAKDEIITRSESKDSLLNLIRLINSYLWFIVAAICMAVVIYAGFLMMTARGDDAQVKKGINILVYAGIGIGVSLMAYAIVNVIVNFFGSG